MITLQQIKDDIQAGKVTRIYYSSGSLWWTHLDTDVSQATEIGIKCQDDGHAKFMTNPNIPQADKDRRDGLYKMIRKPGAHRIPTDPTGAPLYQFTEKKDIENWIAAAENKPEHFGKHGIDAFLKAHHQNCDGKCFNSWDSYNSLIDAN